MSISLLYNTSRINGVKYKKTRYDLPGISAIGNRIHVAGIVILEFEDGRIANIWQTWDRLGLLERHRSFTWNVNFE